MNTIIEPLLINDAIKMGIFRECKRLFLDSFENEKSGNLNDWIFGNRSRIYL
jgi:hypothetical protein